MCVKKTLIVCALAALAACWEPQQVEVLRVVPGIVALPGAQTVAVGEITGPFGDAAGHLLAESLMMLQRFEVLDWSAPFGGRSGRSGWADVQGDWQTADAAFLGSLAEPTLTPHYDIRTALAPDGSLVATYGRTVTLTVSGYFRVLDPRNGLIISAKTLTTESTGPTEYVTVVGADKDWSDSQIAGYFGPMHVAELHHEAVRGLSDALTELVAFSYSPTTVTLYHDRHAPELVRALEGAKKGDWRDAVTSYGQAMLDLEMHAPSQAYMGHYNYGVALAFSGELARGIEEVQVAESQNNSRLIKDMLRTLRCFQEESLQRQSRNQVRQ